MTNDDEGGEGVSIPPKNDDVIYEQPLNILHGKRETCAQLGILPCFVVKGFLCILIFSLCGRDSPMSEEKPRSCRHDLSMGRCLGETWSEYNLSDKKHRKNCETALVSV